MTIIEGITAGLAYVGMMTIAWGIGWVTYRPVTWVAKLATRLRPKG